MIDFDSPEMKRALAADQAKLDAMQEEPNPVFVAMTATVALVGACTSEGLRSAVADETITEEQADDLQERFEANLNRAMNDVNKMVGQIKAEPKLILG